MRAIIMAAGLALASEAAIAEPARFDIKTSDLDLARPEGVRELESRILWKMHVTCGRPGDVWQGTQPESGKIFRACVDGLVLGDGPHPQVVSQAFERARARMIKPN